MRRSMLLYYITDRTQLGSSEAERRRRLLRTVALAAEAGVDAIQLREKDLSARELEALAREAMARLAEFPRTKLLINSRTDVALAAGAHGVHLRSEDVTPKDLRAMWSAAAHRTPAQSVIGVSCHTSEEVSRAAAAHADFAVFAPVFEKNSRSGSGITALAQACAAARNASSENIPVLALGGVTLANAAECLRAGAAGIAGIRLFQQGDLRQTVAGLRKLAASACKDR